MPEEKTKKKRLDSDGRATASAMTGHTRTMYDDRKYRWLRDKSGAQSPPRMGASGVNVSGGLAPHHMFGLKLMKNLTSGMSPEDIADINANYMPVGYRMGDDADWNLIGIEQDVNSNEGTNSGWHKQVHDSQDALMEKLGFKKTKNGYLLYGKPFNEYPTDVRKGIISMVTHQVEMDTEEVLRRASDDFWNRPKEVVEADLAEIRRTSAAAPPPPPQDYTPTRKATQVMMSQDWADAQDSTAWERIRASELNNKQLQRLAQSPGLRGAARALGKGAKEVVPYAGLGLGLMAAGQQAIAGETGEAMGTAVDTVLQEAPVVGEALRSEPVADGSLAGGSAYMKRVADYYADKQARQQAKVQSHLGRNNTLGALRAAEEMGGSTQVGSTPGSWQDNMFNGEASEKDEKTP